MKMEQIRIPWLSAGHSTKIGRDRGTSGNGLIEGVETARIVKRTSEICVQKYGLKVKVDYHDTVLSDIISMWGRLTTKNCILIEWHFNSVANTSVRGTETFVPDNASDFECKLAFCFSHVAHKRLSTTKRGNFKNMPGVRAESESARKKLGWMRLTGENNLPEVEFMSNKLSMETYLNNFEDLCQDYALVIWYATTDRLNVLYQEILNSK